MTENQIRASILEALEAAYVSVFTDPEERDKFLTRKKDCQFDELGIDSLGTMEFCISLEINGVYVITPQELVKIKSLNQLVKVISDSKS